MALAEMHQGVRFESRPQDALSGQSAERTLRKLFDAAKKTEYFTPAEERMLRSAIRLRNELAHTFLTSRAKFLATPEGRRKVLGDIGAARSKIKKAGAIIDSLIDRYLEKYGTTVEEIKQQMEHLWVSDNHASPKGLH